MLDLGSGAGFPGIPLKIVAKDIDLMLLEAKRRRASFLATVVRELGLERVNVVAARAEESVEELGGSFDVVVMRCVANPDSVIPLAAKFVRPDGTVVVSGPPSERRLQFGEWKTVDGPGAGQTRRFAVYKTSDRVV